MPAQIIDGKAIAQEVREEVAHEIAGFAGSRPQPSLMVFLVGDDPASQVYVRMKGRACEKAGITSETRRFDADISEKALLQEISAINNDPAWNGLLVQLPLPGHIDTQKVIEAVAPEKDVDCFHPFNVGRLSVGMPVFSPATPAGIVEMLKRSDIKTAGKHAVILGRSNIVGKPMASLLVQKGDFANALVTIVHSAAADISEYTRQADILIAAIGRPEMIRGDMIKPGAIVIDVGINRIDADNEKGYRLVGDVAYDEALEIAGHITPVPGGVGPMTIAMLLKNTLKAYHMQQG